MVFGRFRVFAVVVPVGITSLSLLSSASVLARAQTSTIHQGASGTPDTVYSYSRDVVPILERSCLECHGGVGEDGEIDIEEGLNMTTYEGLMAGSNYGTVVEPGDVDGSYLVELILNGDMPKEGDLLTTEEIQTITGWIAAGAENN